MSDDDLLKIANGTAENKSAQPTDEELLRSVGQDTSAPVGVGEDMLKSAASGLVKGTGSMLDQAQSFTPAGMLDRAIDWTKTGAHWMSTGEYDGAPSGHLLTPDLAKATSQVSRGADKYEPKTTMGRYAKTTGEFVPSALPFTPKGGLAGRALNLVQNAVVPAVASEAASDLAKATGNEKYADAARIAAAVVAPGAAGYLGRKVAGLPSSVAGANPERVKNADILTSEGIPVTAGQVTGNKALLAREGTTHAGVLAAETHPEEYTKFAMRSIGSKADLATADEIVSASNSIVSDLNRIADSVNVIPNQEGAKILVDAVKGYKSGMTSSTDQLPPIINGVMNDILSAASSKVPIPGATLRKWRTELNRLAAGTNSPQSKELYRKTIDSIDEMVSGNLKLAGRADDWTALEQAREKYRNLLAIEAASVKANNGILDPGHVASELLKQGKRAVARGTRGNLADVTMAAKNVLSKIPQRERVPNSFARFIANAASTAGSLATGAMYFGGFSPATLALGAAGAVLPKAVTMASDAANRSVMWPSVQRMLVEEARRPKGYNSLPDKILRSSTIAGGAGQLDGVERMGRKTGGRVNEYAAEASRLIAAAEHAKKSLGQSTERLLDTPDDVVAHALEAANRSI